MERGNGKWFSSHEGSGAGGCDTLIVGIIVTGNVFAKAEYRYTDFDKGVGKHGALVGVGFRF